MKQLFVIALLFKCLIFSSAEVSVENPQKVRILSVSSITKGTDTSGSSSTINVENTKKIKAILEEAQAKDEEQIDYNEFADEVISAVAEEIFVGGYDPAEVDDQSVVFDYKPLLITYTGTLSLTRGFIQDLSSVSRRDDVLVSYSYNTNSYQITVPLSFRDIIAGYNFEMTVRGDAVTGVLYAWVNEITADYVLELSSSTMTPISNNFDLNIGSFEIDLYSSDFDSYESLLNELTEDLMYETVVEKTTAIVGGLLNEVAASVFTSTES